MVAAKDIGPVSGVQAEMNFELLPQFQRGDVNQDGKVNIFDLLDLLRILAGTQDETSSADVSQDGKVNIFDLLELLKLLSQ